MIGRIAAFASVSLVCLASAASAATWTYDPSNAVSDPAVNNGGNDHSLIINGDSYTFQDGSSFVWDMDTGLAGLDGDVLLGDVGFTVDVDLNQIEWGETPVGGSAPIEPKIEVNLDGSDIDPLTDWTAFEFIAGSLTVIGDLTLNSRQSMDGPMESFSFSDGDVLTLFGRPTNGMFGFQVGEGANGKNLNFGMAGWFGFTDESGTRYCDGKYNICDFNVDLTGEDPPVVPLPLGVFLLPAGLGLMWSLKRRKAA